MMSTAEYAGAGGFFATAEEAATNRCYCDSTLIFDGNNKKKDMGKYISIVGSWISASVGLNNTAVEISAAGPYLAFASTLPIQSAPTNKSLPGGSIKGTLSSPVLDALAGKRIVGLQNKANRSSVISDSLTAAAGGDYARISTMRQVEAAVDGVRAASEPFLGEGMTGAEVAALDTAITSSLSALVSAGGISAYRHQIIMTSAMKIQGEALVQLTIVPAFELRQITVVVGLSAT